MHDIFIIAIVCLTILIITCEIVKEITDLKKFKIFAELESEGILIEDEENEEDE